MSKTKNARRIVQVARQWIGTPYRHQASHKGVGCDCLGLVRGVWREIEGPEPEQIPAYSSAWSEISQRERLLELADKYFHRVDRRAWQIGDLLVFRLRANSVAKHLGIVATSSSFIHAYGGNCVVENSLSHFWKMRIATVARFPCVAKEEAD